MLLLRRTALPFALTLALLLAGCQAIQYRALESFGIEKRDMLVTRVTRARDAQTEAREQFSSALEEFRSVVAVDAGQLERAYDRLSTEYDRSERRAKAVTERIDSVERVGQDLFREWEAELGEYTDAARRRDSERLLRDTRKRYDGLMKAMREAEGSMEPVLRVFRDQVLTLKHNLNAQAIGSLRQELGAIEKQTAALMRDMDRAIAEADRFIANMRTDGA
jgi:hypothetical protein